MKFAFMIHPITTKTDSLMDLDFDGTLQEKYGVDPLGLGAHLHNAIAEFHKRRDVSPNPHPESIDEMVDLQSPLGMVTGGRLYKIPMDAVSILEEPDRALELINEAVEMAVDWGARIIGLGSMTGIVGGRGVHVAEHSPVAVTTGNSLTVYSALQNLYHAIEEFNCDLRQETVAVVGIPGSIASAAAALLAPHCGELILVGRRSSKPAEKLAQKLGADLVLDIPQALSRSRVVITATSTGDCIDQSWLLPGSIVVDVGVPTDVRGTAAMRDDVLVLTGGMVQLPDSMNRDSKLLRFQHGMIPSCLGETMLLALENREENLSLGRTLDLDTIQEIGKVAESHGFDFSRFYSFGHPLDDSSIVRFHKVVSSGSRTRKWETAPPIDQLATHAAKRHSRHINPVMSALGQSSGFVKTFVRGEGNYLIDDEGQRYLDFVSGFGSVNLGHNHPAVVQSIEQALAQQAPGFAQSAVNPYAAALSECIAGLTPPELEMVFFTNSGTEAVEASLKLARAATGRPGLLSCQGSFHGKSLGSLSVTGNRDYQAPFAPLLPDCDSIPYGDFTALERALSTRRFAAFVVEPIQAEGGMNVPPAGYLREAQALCRANGTLLIVDEIQSGLGRTGAMFAVDHEQVTPDVVTIAKSLGGGLMPVGAMVARRDHWLKAYGSIQSFALHTSTFGGGSLACAAGLAALRTTCNENLADNARDHGEKLLNTMKEFCKRFRCLNEVRGRGLLLGLEFSVLPASIRAHWKGSDQTGLAAFLMPGLEQTVKSFHVLHAMQSLLIGHNIYTQFTRSNPLVLRIEPPLTITPDETQHFLNALETTCRDIDHATDMLTGTIAKSSIGEHNANERNASGMTAPSREPSV